MFVAFFQTLEAQGHQLVNSECHHSIERIRLPIRLLTEQMRISCTVFDYIQPVICGKLSIWTHPTCIWRPRRVDPGRILRKLLASENYSPGLLYDTVFSHFSRTPTWQVTRDHSIYRYEHGKNRTAHAQVTAENVGNTFLKHCIQWDAVIASW